MILSYCFSNSGISNLKPNTIVTLDILPAINPYKHGVLFIEHGQTSGAFPFAYTNFIEK